MVIVHIAGKHLVKGFYRSRPSFHNVFSLFIDSSRFALSVAIVAYRVFILLVVSCLYMGRIDTPVLAKGFGQIESMGIQN